MMGVSGVVFVIALMSFLNSLQRSCGLEADLSMLLDSRCSMSFCSLILHSFTASRRWLLLSEWRGHIHHPFPIKGVSVGAYFTFTSQWSVGTGD